jgi:Mg2+/Co2+ transporter CorB
MRGALEHHHEEGSVIGEDKYMIGGLIDLEKIKVNEVMTHRNDIFSIDSLLDVKKIINFVSKSKFTRIPLWKDSKDNIVGILHAKDVLHLVHSKKGTITNKDIGKLIRKPWFIPDSTDIKSQLLAFKQNQEHLTIVVDEYGELMGLLSLEDIIEEIVGQIDDEYDTNSHLITKGKDDSIIVNGDVSIRDLNREMHWNIADQDATSIGGLIFNLAKKVPKVGASFKSQGFTFRVMKKQKNKISRVNIRKND